MKFQQKSLQHNNFRVFRKWGRKNYSLFSILNKVVKISVLPVTYLLAVPSLSVAMEQDTAEVKMQYDLDEVEVTASRVPVIYSQVARVLSVIERQEIERAPAESVQDLLEFIAGVDVRQRGPEGVQADVSIRGGSFDQTLILLNGINITDPQTGHHNLNLPVSLSQIERIEILEGPAARVYGPNAFSGAINIVTKQPDENTVSAALTGGSFGYFNSNLSGSFQTGLINHFVSGNRKGSGGYIENTDFKSSNLFYSGSFQGNTGKLTMQAGLSGKGFGANSFYTPVFPEQFEETQTIFSSVKWESEKTLHITPALYWRRHTDKFMLFRFDSPEWYRNHNFHRTDVWGVNLNSWFLWTGGKTAYGAEFRSENIQSNVLGEESGKQIAVPGEDAVYTKSKNRATTSVFLEHSWFSGKWNISAGVMVNHITDNETGVNFFPGVDMGYQLLPTIKIIASWNTSLRMPTFTDLYYSGPVNSGNPNLKPEKTSALETGIKLNSKFIQGHTVLFYRRGINLIDWVKSVNDELWQSMNHTEIISRGAEAQLQYFPKNHLDKFLPNRIRISYFFNDQLKEHGEFISYYVLDNLRHKFVASVNQSVFKRLSVDVSLVFQDREGSFSFYKAGEPAVETPYESFWLADIKFLYQYNTIDLYVSANNLFNKQYFDLGNVTQPGRWIKAGVSWHLKFN
jgi:vitamin B12 transporter